MDTKVKYIVNGAASNFFKRLVMTKTFAVVAVFVLTSALRWNAGDITLQQLIEVCQVGVIGILLRAALAKAELAANASNPAVANVEAVEVRKPGYSGIATGLFMMLCVFGGALVLSGCGAGKGISDVITNPDGKPIISGEVCVNTANGKFCYVPNEPVIVEPEVKAETVAASTAAPVAAVPVVVQPAPLTVAPAPVVERQLIPPVPRRTLEK